MFSLEGRAVPALYLIGWVGTLLGVSLGIVATLGGGANPGARWMFLLALAIAAVGFLAAGGSQAIERGRRPELPYRGPSPLLAFGAVISLTLIGIIVILAPLAAIGLDPASPVAVAISLVLTTLVYAGVVRMLVVGTGALSWRDLGLVVPPSRALRELLLGAAWGLPVLLLTGFLGLALQGLLGSSSAPPNPLPQTVEPLGIAFNFLSAAVLAPIGEELFFRGFATTAWNRMLGAWPAIVRGAIFFSAAHIATQLDTSALDGATRALYAFLLRLPVGIALGWLFLRRGSLWAPIGLHAVFNGLQVFALAAVGASGE
jgi:membrane protease YdiL (CAAX protease family)